MKIIIFGASGMLGQGVVRECLLAADVSGVAVVTRQALAISNPKLQQIVTPDPTKFSLSREDIRQYDACFFCLGVSATGMTEEKYRQLTYELTMNVASQLQQANPAMAFIYVSGAGTDSSEQGKVMWARVKGKTENALLKLGFAHAWMFRPAIIQPLNGARSKTASYRIFYQLLTPLFPLLKYLFPTAILTTEDMGKAMLNAVRYGYDKPILEKGDISQLAKAGGEQN
ncbi:Rossmann-fold NAD(P)-binding domain-containing protein [Yersinia rohdei]|uniref:NAD(P)H-binding protein n=1 Tax=Yersinia rohdei TaxID=29485 RepID=UPI0005DCAC2E|nr:NAD(P)H-binding protein [Yersinia rohdei]CQJ47132.1 oxidoreductase [Yersinia rohdei]